jgi:predicted DNA-binding ribbon-helix-helix protein
MQRMDTQRTIRASSAFWKKAKIAAAIEGVPLGVFLENLVDQREQVRRAMPSPLHRPILRDDDDLG